MSKVRRCRFGQSRKYLPSTQFWYIWPWFAVTDEAFTWSCCRFRITVVRSNNWISHSQFIWITHCWAVTSLYFWDIIISSHSSSPSWILSLAYFAGHIMSGRGAQTGLTCPHVLPVWSLCTLVSPHTDWRPWPGHSWVGARAEAGSGTGLSPHHQPLLLSITTLPISVMVNSKQIQASTITGVSNTFLLLCCIKSCHPIIRSVDGWWRLYWIWFREERGGGPCYQFYCYDIPRLPPLRLGDHWGRGIIICGAMLRLLLAVTSDNVLTSDRCWPRPRGWSH